MARWQEWDEWLKEGYFITYQREGAWIYEFILQRDFAHYEYEWPETISALSTSGPYVPGKLEVTKGYDPNTNTNRIWQMIFGIKGQVYIYIELPTDIHRHGLPKAPKPSKELREVSHYTEWMSPFHEPSFITCHYMLRPETYRIAFSAYNPNSIDIKPTLNIMIAKLTTERIGSVVNGRLIPARDRFREILDKLYRRVVPVKPITIMPVRAPAEAPAGE